MISNKKLILLFLSTRCFYTVLCVDSEKKLLKLIKDGHVKLDGKQRRVNVKYNLKNDTNMRFFGDKIPLIKGNYGKECYTDIGCFSVSEFQGILGDTFRVLPKKPEEINPQFLLFTAKNREIPYNFTYKPNSTQLFKSNFNPEDLTVILVHGFRSGFEPWMKESKDLLLSQKQNNLNVIVVDWHNGAKVPVYKYAVSNSKITGALIAFWVKRVVDIYKSSHKINNDKFYLIGHSLGAHTVGDAGKRLNNPQVSRITGLDPAGKDFDTEDIHLKLVLTDAQIVDLVHTDMADNMFQGLGVPNDFGDFDFYPNGGTAQPGCRTSIGIEGYVKAAIEDLDISCSHSRAHMLVRALGKEHGKCSPIGYECSDWETFLEGRCGKCENNGCHLMGFYPFYWNKLKINKNIRRKYYLNTSANKEYCLNHYQIAFHVSKTSDSATGQYILTLDNKPKKLVIKRIMSKVVAGGVHTLLVTFPYNLTVGHISKAGFQWERNTDYRRTQRGTKIKIDFIEINFMSNIDKKIRNQNSVILCPKVKTMIKIEDDKAEFVKCAKLKPIKLARYLTSYQLMPMTAKEDIYSVDYTLIDEVYFKIKNSSIDAESDIF